MSYYGAARPSFPQLYAAAAASAAYPGAESQGASATAAQAYAAYAAQAAAAAQAAQAAQAAPAVAPAQPQPEMVGTATHLTVSGCSHSTVGGIVRGDFTANGQNHGRPTYKKDIQVNGLDVQLYYWDERDGASFCGWWFGPKVGGDQVWAYHASNVATTPPKTGWKVPYDGPVDNTMLISPKAAPATDASQYGGYQYSQHYAQEQSIKQKQVDLLTQQMIAQQQKAMQQSKQEELRRQQEENRLRQQEEMKRRQAEQQRKQMEEAKRQAELRKVQFEEQKAASALRCFLAQKVHVAKNQAELAVAHQELAELMQLQLPKCGSVAEKVQAECAQAVEMTLKRLEAAEEAKRKEEERLQEQAKKTKEAQEKAAELLKEMGGKVTRAEELLEQLSASTEQLDPQKDMKSEILGKLAKSMEAKATEATEAVQLCQDFLKEHRAAMSALNVKPPGLELDEDTPTFVQVLSRMQEMLKKKDTLLKDGTANKEKLLRKAEAKKKMDLQLQKFKRYDADKDELLNKKEVGLLARKEYGITLLESQLSRILKGFETPGVKKADFHRLIVQIGIAREMQMDAARKKKREAHDQEIEALKEELLEKVKEADGKFASVEEKMKEMEEATKPLLNCQMPSTELQPLLEQLEEQATALQELISGFKREVAEMKEGVDSEVTRWFAQQCRSLDIKTSSLEPKLILLNLQIRRSHGDLQMKVTTELEALEKSMLAMIRYHQRAKSLSVEDLYSEFAQKEDVEKKAFLNFFENCAKETEEANELSSQDLSRLFDHLASSEKGISKERMMGLIRVYKKVIKETVLSEELGLKSASKRRLEVKEIVEVMSQEAAEEEVARVRCRALRDDLEGWATVSGNDGSQFLVDAGGYKVVKETILTETFELDSAEAKEAAKQIRKDAEERKLKIGEMVDVWVWPKKEERSGLVRLKCRCRDGAVGWVTAVGNAGTVFLEVV